MSDKTNGYLLRIIEDAANDVDHQDHSSSEQYLTKFRAMESHFFKDVHPQVDVGLAYDAAEKGDKSSRIVMTIHGCIRWNCV
ncbi:MAG: hypothetical protein OXI17_10295 [Gammaproteobacteria bacterium]|nr:hypothetical protein [Gammaproteobacteria bacterium]